jgi:methyltransferase
MLPAVLFLLVFIPMIAEARRSTANDRRLRAAGAIEPAGDVYQVMQLAYPLCFLLPIAEAWWRGRGFGAVFAAGLAVFVAAKALKYWAIGTLGERWTFRVLVPPGSQRIASGPYRLMRHPNYVAVAGELLGVAVMAQAPATGLIAFLVFVSLMLRRIRVEEAALALRSD